MVDLYTNDRFLEYKDSYNYYDIDVDNILLFKISNNEYIIRYNDVNKMKIAPLQLKIKNCFGEEHTLKNNNRKTFILNNDKELFRKYREIWNNITESKGINNAKDFVETTLDDDDDDDDDEDDDDEFIAANIHNNTNFLEDDYRNKLVIVLHYVIDNYPKISLIQVKHINAYKST